MNSHLVGEAMIKAVVTDVDGTITDYSDQLGLEALGAIRKLEAKGIKVLLCSGNALCVLKALSRYIGCSGPVIAENGGVVEHKGGFRILSENRTAREALAALREVYGSKISESWSNRYRFADMAILRTLDLGEVEKVVRKFDGLKVIDSGFAYHILDKKVDKRIGVQCVAKALGLELSELAGIGDSITDLEMLKVCGFKGVVGNGDPRVKEIADYVAEESFGKGFSEIAEEILKV